MWSSLWTFPAASLGSDQSLWLFPLGPVSYWELTSSAAPVGGRRRDVIYVPPPSSASSSSSSCGSFPAGFLQHKFSLPWSCFMFPGSESFSLTFDLQQLSGLRTRLRRRHAPVWFTASSPSDGLCLLYFLFWDQFLLLWSSRWTNRSSRISWGQTLMVSDQ